MYNVKISATKLGLGRKFTFQQDNDPKYSAKSTMEYFKKNKISKLEWPSQSPDLSPIEHLWKHIGRETRKQFFVGILGLKSRIKEVWDQISTNVTANLIFPMKRRLEAVIKAKNTLKILEA